MVMTALFNGKIMYSLIAKWTILEGSEHKAWVALKELAKEVEKNEKDTWMYLVNKPNKKETSLPTPSHLEVTFHEVYKDKQAFLDHVTGPIFTNFVAKYQDLFLTTTVTSASGEKVTSPFVICEFLEQEAGYIRKEIIH